MKLTNPFDMAGYINIEASYTTGKASGGFSLGSTGAEADINVDWDSMTAVVILVKVDYQLFLMQGGGLKLMQKGEGDFKFAAKWRADFTEDGLELAPDGAQPKLLGKSETEGELAVSASPQIGQSASRDKHPYVEMAVTFTAGSTDSGISIGLGPVSGSSSASSKAQSMQMALRINFNVKSRPAPAPPARVPVKQQTIVVGSFEFGFWELKKVKALGSMMDGRKLRDWYFRLPQVTRDKLSQGELPGGKKIVMTGYTDNVGEEHMNLQLGRKRAIAVAKEFEDMIGVSWEKVISTPSRGEQDVLQENKNLEKKEPKHRRVEVTIFVEG